MRGRTGVGEPEAASTSTSTVRQILDDGVRSPRVERLRQPVRLEPAAVAASERAVGRRQPHQVGCRRRTAGVDAAAAGVDDGGGGVEVGGGGGQVEQAEDDTTGGAQAARATPTTAVRRLKGVVGRADVAVTRRQRRRRTDVRRHRHCVYIHIRRFSDRVSHEGKAPYPQLFVTYPKPSIC